MSTYIRSLLTAALLVIGVSAAADSVCSQGNLTRTVSIVYDAPGQPVPCEVLYEKPSEGAPNAQRLWRAENEVGYCEDKAASFISKLTDLGWQCEDANSEPAPGQDG